MKSTMMTIAMLVGALIAASAAAYFANDYIDSSIARREKDLMAKYENVRVVVAAKDLVPGSRIGGSTAAARGVPRAFLHSEAVLADDWNAVSGRTLAVAVKSGEPILHSHLANNPAAGFSAGLEDGKRALTFPVDDEASISGLLTPGDHIDIFFTTDAGRESVTVPLLYSVPIIATGVETMSNSRLLAKGGRGPGNYRTVTVSVTPEDAAKITHALDTGKITVTLRKLEDESPLQLARVTKNTLLYGNRPNRSSTPRNTIEVILGGR